MLYLYYIVCHPFHPWLSFHFSSCKFEIAARVAVTSTPFLAIAMVTEGFAYRTGWEYELELMANAKQDFMQILLIYSWDLGMGNTWMNTESLQHTQCCSSEMLEIFMLQIWAVIDWAGHAYCMFFFILPTICLSNLSAPQGGKNSGIRDYVCLCSRKMVFRVNGRTLKARPKITATTK